MLVLLNRELVLVETMTWARYRIAEVLVVHPHEVFGKWVLSPAKQLAAEFSVSDSLCPEISDYLLKRVFAEVSSEMRVMLSERLEGLKQRRGSKAVGVEEPTEVCDPRHRLVTIS